MGKVGYAEIYFIVSPAGKRYIGKANCYDSKGKKHGTNGRWKGHIRDARLLDGGRCRLLNEEIRTHKVNDFVVLPLLSCKMQDTRMYEKLFIKEYKSLYNIENPDGLNINEGGNSGNLSEETRKRMSQKRKEYISNNPDKCKVSEDTKQKISKTILDHVIRYDHDGTILPKYVKYINWKDRRGYQVVSHPSRKNKYFVSSTKQLHELFLECMQYLQEQ